MRKHWLVLSILVAAIAGGQALSAYAQPEPAGDGPSSTKKVVDKQALAEAGLSTATPPSVKTVRLVSSMVDVAVLHDAEVMGHICDVAFDLETGQLALVVVKENMAKRPVDQGSPLEKSEKIDKQSDRDPDERFMLLPFVEFDQADVFEWEDDQTISRLPKALTRDIAQKTFSAVNRDIYWSRYLKELTTELGSKFDDRNFELATFSLLKRRGIVDANGDSIGKLVDFAVEPSKGDILYCVIECNDKKHRAIPLGAFVMPKDNYRWTIELSTQQIFTFPGFELESPPTQIDRGWEEYVAVRYGRDGLQEVAKGEDAEPIAD